MYNIDIALSAVEIEPEAQLHHHGWLCVNAPSRS